MQWRGKSGAEILNVRRPSSLLGNVREGTKYKYSSMNTSFKFSYVRHLPSFYSVMNLGMKSITHKRVRDLEIGISATGSDYNQELLWLHTALYLILKHCEPSPANPS
jgi:hypothetical protein